jgi:hypothetical protein
LREIDLTGDLAKNSYIMSRRSLELEKSNKLIEHEETKLKREDNAEGYTLIEKKKRCSSSYDKYFR